MTTSAPHTKTAVKPVGPYSATCTAAGLLFISGQIGIVPDTGELATTYEDEVRQALDNLTNVLAEAGCTWHDARKVELYLTDMSTFALVNKLYATYVTEPYPARVTVGVASLPKGARIEVAAVAVPPHQTQV